MGTADWLQTIGDRHVGGGPATTSREGIPLKELAVTPRDPETNILDPQTGEPIPWDWAESRGGRDELLPVPHSQPEQRGSHRCPTRRGIQMGQYRNPGRHRDRLQVPDSDYEWNPAAFDENGELLAEFVKIQDPTNDNCGLCHGLVHDDVEDPLVTTAAHLSAGARSPPVRSSPHSGFLTAA